MKKLHTICAICVIGASIAQAGDIITVGGFANRTLYTYADIWDVGSNEALTEEVQAEPFHEDPWVFGIVADLYHPFGEAIAVADQNSSVVDGPVTASVHAAGFASGDALAGGESSANYVASSADARSEMFLSFRVEVPVDYVLTGMIWSSGLGHEEWGSSTAETVFEAFGVTYAVQSDQIPVSATGTLQPGITYRLEFDIDVVTEADYDDNNDVSHRYYAAGGVDVDLFLTTNASAVGDDPNLRPSLTASPNPFSAGTRLFYASPQGKAGTVEIFDLRGSLLRRWGNVPPSGGPLDWDGRGPDGHPLPAGTYFYRLMSGEHIQTEKMTLIK